MKIEVNDFNLKDTILSGSCFRVTENEDGSFTNILKDRVINIKQEGNHLIVNSSNMDNIKEIIINYFDLKTNYNEIDEALTKNDNNMKTIIDRCKGYKILSQDPFEMCISYIISQNNNVKRISKTVEEISKKYGNKIVYDNKEYYLFPTYEQLKKLKLKDFTNLKVGFRDKYLYDFICNYEKLKDINSLSTVDALNELMKIKGIGLKVASCILLFGYKRFDTFPIDTWVKKFISENYNIKNNQKTIEKFAKDRYKEYSGLAIQYMFHSQRNIK